MKWIVRHDPSGKYICSSRLLVDCRQFARKFNSRKQVGIYLSNSDFKKDECSLLEWKNVNYSEDEINKKINQ